MHLWWLSPLNGRCAAFFFSMALFCSGFAHAQGIASAPFPQRIGGRFSPTKPVAVIFSVHLNGKPVSSGTVLQRLPDGELLVSAKDLTKWRLRRPKSSGLLIDKVWYYPLSALKINSYHVDTESQSLFLKASASAFLPTMITKRQGQNIRVTPPSLGAFFNYNLYAQHTIGNTQEGGYFKLGVFSPLGVVTTSFIVQHGMDFQQIANQSVVVRLNSLWTRNFPNRMTALQVGDFITQPGAWGQAVRMGGVQYGTNFATQPYLVTTPLYSVRGQAVLPSMVDVYVNHVLVSRSKVPSGPFAITHLPVITGSGNISTVVTNMLGAQQVITQPFFSSQQLLRPGLTDFSFAAGWIRQDYGIRSNDYGSAAAVGTYRMGLSNTFTGEIHGELQANRNALGFSGSWVVSPLGIFSGSVAYSHNPCIHPGQGVLASLGFERITQGLSFSANAQIDSLGFTQLGDVLGYPRLNWQGNATISQGIGYWGSLSASYITQKYFGEPAIKITQASYNIGLGRWGYVSASLLRTFSPEQNTQVGLYWTVPFGSRSNVSLTAQSGGTGTGGTLWTATAQRNLPVGAGFGYLLQASSNRQTYLQGQYRGPIGTYTAQMQSIAGQGSSYRLEATGGMGILARTTFFSRTINDSFALIQVPHIAGVQVYANNNLIGRTHTDGYLIIPQLQPYQHNVISINQQDLPLDAEVPTLDMPLVPAYLSGSVLTFPIEVVRSATFTLVQENGKPVPPGAMLQIRGQKKSYPVGFHGLSYLSGLAVHNTVDATWSGGQCSFTLTDPKTTHLLPNLGRQVCRNGELQ
ncbi:fimbria/pilus outer membrane usher protein [Acidithiobacillus sp. M4-SHS-6]|uniref:fimbria/pilus outer membrane usher protein n=1 Tax=Acidithiobacillus sp. M4-SHS-6 TaxID=3383024 RepID=UPI0039BE0A0D